MIEFTQASTESSYVRLALCGASGTGKTLTALKLARWLGDRVCVIDTERSTAKLYADHPDTPKPYFVRDLRRFQADNYIALLAAAADQGFDVCIIDSLTPSWNGTNGILDLAGSDVRGWKTATPKYHELMNAVTGYNDRMHVIVTLRSKMDYALTPDPATGKLRVEKKGLAPIHREETPYEFDIVGDLDMDHTLRFGGVGKSRCPELDGREFSKPGKEVADIINAWLRGGD